MTSNQTASRPVSESAERKLREAMDRLLKGTPLRTDGRLLKENLYKEANVSRATMNRAADVIADWDKAVENPRPRNPKSVQAEEQLSQMRQTVNELRTAVRELQEQLTAAASVISAQHNQLVDLCGAAPSVVVLDRTRLARGNDVGTDNRSRRRR